MARKPSASKADAPDAAIGNDGNQVPPSSTLAAQIVSNRSDGKQQHAKSKATFGQLLDEIRANPENVEADATTNHKLISVVAKAGLDPLLREDPFAEANDLVSQAVACLDVIRISIERSPDVIFHVETDRGGSGVQLVCWLLPKILSVVNQGEENELQAQLHQLLRVLYKVLARNPSLWTDSSRLLLLYRSCAEGLSFALIRQSIHINALRRLDIRCRSELCRTSEGRHLRSFSSLCSDSSKAAVWAPAACGPRARKYRSCPRFKPYRWHCRKSRRCAMPDTASSFSFQL